MPGGDPMATNDVRDFRGFLAVLERAGELVVVEDPVSPVHELAARVKANEAAANKAFLFRHVAGHTIPVAAGLFGNSRRHLLGLRMQSLDEFAARLDAAIARPIPPEIVTGEVPAQEVRFAADEGLDRLPIPTHFREDAGPYITAGVVILRDGQRRNAGVYRIQDHGPRRLTVFINRFKDGNRILTEAARAGRDVDLAIAIGVDPAVFVAAMWPVPPSVEEFGVVGALLGRPLELARALTVDAEVPAHAEVVIEGRIHPGDTEVEGPFFDITVQATSSGPQPAIEVTAITTRRVPIFHTVLGGDSREHFKSRGNDFWRDYQTAGRLRLPGLPRHVKGTYDIFFPPAACNLHAVVAIRKQSDLDPRVFVQVMFDTFRYLKRVIIVDDDIDIRDASQVEWAVATRVGLPEQISIGTGLGSILDVSGNQQVVKVGIDATVPLGRRSEPDRTPGRNA